MLLSYLVSACLAIPLVAGYLVAPPVGSTPAPLTVTSCSRWVVVTSSMTCASITTTYGITIAQFEALNPILGSSCQLLSGFAFCVEENFGGTASSSSATTLITVSTPTSTPATTTTTSPGNGVTTPTPYQAGMTTSCNSFRLIVADDQCGSIAAEAGVSLSDFYLWNPTVGSSCGSLWAGYYVCTGVIGGPTSTKPSVPSTTSPGNGITTPTPIQPGMTTSCGDFRLVQINDQCGSIAASAGISLRQFYAWNPSVGTACSTLYAGNYVCVGLTTCAPVLPLPAGRYCGRVGVPVGKVGVGALASYDTGSPYVSSLSACSTKCLNTAACTGFFFVQGVECHLRYGPASFSPSGNAGSNPYYESSCFSCPSTASCALNTSAASYCGRVGVPIAATNVGALVSYDTGSPYVYSAGVCAAQCLNTPTCSSFFFVEGERCHLRYGPISFSPNGGSGSTPFYDIACFPFC
ncbi:hypothetical protein V495_05576 [Pseudogymnoascus sp. VKM F-4514 (FW-929)]|nr:hypothetical protein V495_05576 [Pseudogymnoascus sp. VKM F-4514 (FW-929)]KFY55096.1 hypothetical protein V497_07211 [Pseudogymnoascus sp. VKM F-4516 (FW-969)]